MGEIAPVVSAVTTAAAGLIVWLIQDKRQAVNQKQRQASTFERALLVLMRNQLVTAHRQHVANWEINTAEMQSFREMHDMYISLGGNGPASHLLEDLSRMRLTVE